MWARERQTGSRLSVPVQAGLRVPSKFSSRGNGQLRLPRHTTIEKDKRGGNRSSKNSEKKNTRCIRKQKTTARRSGRDVKTGARGTFPSCEGGGGRKTTERREENMKGGGQSLSSVRLPSVCRCVYTWISLKQTRLSWHDYGSYPSLV